MRGRRFRTRSTPKTARRPSIEKLVQVADREDTDPATIIGGTGRRITIISTCCSPIDDFRESRSDAFDRNFRRQPFRPLSDREAADHGGQQRSQIAEFPTRLGAEATQAYSPLALLAPMAAVAALAMSGGIAKASLRICATLSSAHLADFETFLFGLGDECRIVHGRMKGRAQRGNPLGGHTGRRQDRTIHLQRRKHELRIFLVRVVLGEFADRRHVGKNRIACSRDLNRNVDLLLREPIGAR